MKNKKLILFLFSFLFTTYLISLGFSINEPNFPKSENQFVNDFADILDEEDENYLFQLFSIVENETTVEMVFVSIK